MNIEWDSVAKYNM